MMRSVLGRRSPARTTRAPASRSPAASRYCNDPRTLMYASRSVMSLTRPRNPLVPKASAVGVWSRNDAVDMLEPNRKGFQRLPRAADSCETASSEQVRTHGSASAAGCVEMIRSGSGRRERLGPPVQVVGAAVRRGHAQAPGRGGLWKARTRIALDGVLREPL